jgi:hypothetical protein
MPPFRPDAPPPPAAITTTLTLFAPVGFVQVPSDVNTCTFVDGIASDDAAVIWPASFTVNEGICAVDP